MNFMKSKSSFLVSSLLLGAVVALTTSSAQASIIQNTFTYNQDIIGFKRTLTDNLGRDLKITSVSSPSFGLNSISGNGTNSVTTNSFGGLVPADTPFTLTTNVGDLSGNNSLDVTAVGQPYVIAKGVPTPLAPISSGYSCTTQGTGKPYLAVQRTIALPPTVTAIGGINEADSTLQCQGDALALNNRSSSNISAQISTKSIPGYQDPQNLGTFPPAQTITLQPGLNIIPVAKSVPEPTSTLEILAFGSLATTGFVFKRLQKKQYKPCLR